MRYTSCSQAFSSNSDNSSNAGLLNLNSNNTLSNSNANVSTLKPKTSEEIKDNALYGKTLPLGRKRLTYTLCQ